MLNDLPPALRPRTRALNDHSPRADRRYVLCWLQQSLRATDNPAIDVAVWLANSLGLPCLVYHGIREDYPYASDRLHHFLVGASATLEQGLERRGIGSATYLSRPSHEERGLVYRLAEDAACVVTDDQPLFVARWQADRFAARTETPVLAVDANRMVPLSLLPEGIDTTKWFRAAHKPLRGDASAVPNDIDPALPPYEGPLCFTPDRPGTQDKATLGAWIAECRIDHSLPPVPFFEASQDRLDEMMEQMIREVLPVYRWRRNNPADDASASMLSPYLHFGMIGPREIVRQVAGSDAVASSKWKYLDELLNWREWFAYRAVQRDAPTSWLSVPKAARETLSDHASDPRPALASLDDLIHGRSGDETWDAAQRQFLCDGYMHNNLRMYWGKKIIEWTPDPQTAWSTACYLNDRLSLDGRDPATYGNMEWVFGHGRPAYRENPIYGLVAPKSDGALRKRPGVIDWLAREAKREGPQISVPDAVPDYTGDAPPYFPMSNDRS